MLTGEQAPVDRTLFWRYKANAQRAVRSGDWKYLKLNNQEFLFNVAADQRERANLALRHPGKLAELKQQWESWNEAMLPITADVRTHGVSGKVQADKYSPQAND